MVAMDIDLSHRQVDIYSDYGACVSAFLLLVGAYPFPASCHLVLLWHALDFYL